MTQPLNFQQTPEARPKGNVEIPEGSSILSSLRAYLAAALLAIGAAAPAHAGETQPSAENAEHIQLAEGMKQYAARNAWAGVEANYKRLLELEKKGEQLTYADHKLGAEAAKTVGDINEYKLRLERAAAAPAATETEKAEVQAALAEIEANYGTVTITFTDKKGNALAEPEVFPFAPDQRASILYVNNNFLGNGMPYEGLMPQGTYTVGSTTFIVTPGAKTNVRISSKEKEPKEPAYDLTAGFRVSGAASWMRGSTTESSPVPGPFGGFGLRGGIGGELALTPHVGLLAEGGYQGFTSNNGALLPDHLSAAYGWLAGTARTNNGLKLALGPSAALGSAQVTPESEAPLPPEVDPKFAVPTFETKVILLGAAASAEYPLLGIGSYQLGMEARSTVLVDGERSWSSATVGVSLSRAFDQE